MGKDEKIVNIYPLLFNGTKGFQSSENSNCVGKSFANLAGVCFPRNAFNENQERSISVP